MFLKSWKVCHYLEEPFLSLRAETAALIMASYVGWEAGFLAAAAFLAFAAFLAGEAAAGEEVAVDMVLISQ